MWGTLYPKEKLFFRRTKQEKPFQTETYLRERDERVEKFSG